MAASFNYLIDNSYIITFRVRASTDGRVYNNGAYVRITVIVCGGETLVNSPLNEAEGKFIKLFLEGTKDPTVTLFDEVLYYDVGNSQVEVWEYQEN